METWEHKLGLIVPSWNTVMEYETQRMAGNAMSVHAMRISHTADTEENLLRLGKEAPAAARLLAHAKVEVICYGCTAAGFLKGPERDEDVSAEITQATGTAERDTALDMLQAVPGSRHLTVGADKGYDTKDFVRECRDMDITPRVARKQRSGIDARTTRHEGYRISQRIRKRVEEIFGWVKTVAGGHKLRYRGVEKNQLWAEVTMAGYNLVRMAKLTQVPV